MSNKWFVTLHFDSTWKELTIWRNYLDQIELREIKVLLNIAYPAKKFARNLTKFDTIAAALV